MKAKRVLPLVLSLLMAGGAFAGLAGCNKGGNGDGGENPPPPGHSHNYSLWHDNNDGTHSPMCSGHTDPECDVPIKTSEKPAHEYDNAQDTTCNQCGHVRTVTPSDDTSTALPADKKIYVVGDSTACDYVKSNGEHTDKNTYYVVRYGYGTQLHEYLNVQKYQVENLALSGRSSKSFLTESNYTTLKNSIGAGDYLIIGFGHNDQKTDMDYYTNPNLETTDATTTNGPSFKYTLYENYVKLAEEKGATPILCTPIVRYNPDTNKYDNSASGHKTEDKSLNGVTYKGGDYAQAIRNLAEEKSVALVDLTAITKQIYTEQGNDALQYHAYRSYKLDTDGTTKIPDNADTTHLNELGAKMVAYQFAQALNNTSCGLKAQVKSTATAPTYDNDFNDRVNESFVKPVASAFDPEKASKIWTGVTEEGWYGTVFGDVGGADKIATKNFGITASDGTFTLACLGNGKFSSSTDGMAAIFMPIDATKNITAEVTATVTSAGSADKQSSFGLMLRDDIYIDTYDAGIKSNYVSAGVLNSGAIFSMKNEIRSSTVGAASIAETSYTLRIVKEGTSITATVIQGSNAPVTQTYADTTAISLVESDEGSVYLCLYAVRNITVSFTNVNVTVS